MPQNVAHFLRSSFLRPRIVARHLIDLRFSNDIIAQGAVLAAVLSALTWAILPLVFARYDLELPVNNTLPLSVDLAFSFGAIFLTSHIVMLLARSTGVPVNFRASVTIYIWFGILESALMLCLAAFLYALGPLSAILFIPAAIWGIWALGSYWSELLQHPGFFMGLALIIIASLINSAILLAVIEVLNLPIEELPTNV
ncbi:MAG: hypothetical protein V3V13_12365 [Paracoccaceae bacterium]